MDRELLIKFLHFIGIVSSEIDDKIMTTEFNLTDVILGIAARKIEIDETLIFEWYEKFKNESM